MQENSNVEPTVLGSLLLDVGIELIRAGANSARIDLTLRRISLVYNHNHHADIGPKSISLSLQSKEGQELFAGTRSTAHYGVNFKVLSGISRMSWNLTENAWSLVDVRKELERLKALPHYPRIVVLLSVAMAGASFCYTFGGDAVEMSITFGATFFGLWVKQELLKQSINTYICTFAAALVAAMFTGAFYKAGLGLELEHAYVTCVLFLVPGVPLINFFSDLIAGNIIFSLDRGVNALVHSMAIAFGLAASFFIYQFYS